MAIQTLKVEYTGISPLLQNNPQTVDVFNAYSIKKKPLTAKRTKTEDDVLSLRIIETESKVFWDETNKEVYIPTRWVMASLAKHSFKQAKISKDAIRGSVFTTTDKAKLIYEGMEKVKKINDISNNNKFVTLLILPQQQVRLAKSFPIFHNWSFSMEIEYEDTVIDFIDLKRILEYGAKFGGFGDFRPSYGRATAEVTDV
jgi:hypothetical protein